MSPTTMSRSPSPSRSPNAGAVEADVDAVERIVRPRQDVEVALAGRVGDRDRQRTARGRVDVVGIGVGEVLDQRLDRRRRRVGVEGDDELRPGAAAGRGADRPCRRADIAAGEADLPGARALVADRRVSPP